MALFGKAAILIWNDIAPAAINDFYAWHNGEHLPERLAIPGFLRGRRYARARGTTPQNYFTLYETATIDVSTSADYLARLNAPTPWSTTLFKSFLNMQRALCSVPVSLGPGAGGALATISFGAGHDPALLAPLAGEILPAIAAMPLITGAHLCIADEAASAVTSAEQALRGGDFEPPARAVLIEGCDIERVADAVDRIATAPAMQGAGALTIGLYRLEFTRLALDGAIA